MLQYNVNRYKYHNLLFCCYSLSWPSSLQSGLNQSSWLFLTSINWNIISLSGFLLRGLSEWGVCPRHTFEPTFTRQHPQTGSEPSKHRIDSTRNVCHSTIQSQDDDNKSGESWKGNRGNCWEQRIVQYLCLSLFQFL